VSSDIFSQEHIIQTVGVVASKNLLADLLRDVFRGDREYQYVDDIFGFPKTPSNLGLDPAAGIEDEETTRIMIGSTYRYDVKFYPAITIKNTSTRYVPISFNQDYMGIMYRKELLMDGYGNNTIISTPAYHTLVGAWDQTFEIKVTAESEIDREEITDIVQTVLMGSRRLELQDAGLFIKTLSTSGEQEEPYANNYLYSTSITLDTRSEWKIHIPISNVVERIGFILQIGNTETEEYVDSLEVNFQITQADDL
jgi:hypothetical protein